MSDERVSVGCAGAGTLGAAIMHRLLDCGHRVLVWNRSPDKLAPLTTAGATAVATPGELAGGADLLITCVTDGRAIEQTVFGEHGIASAGAAGKLLIDMSTIDAALTRTLAARLREQCAMGWLDAPISGGAPAGGRADSRLLQEYLPKMAASDFSVEGRLDIMLKDLAMIGELARGAGAVTPVTALVEQLYRKLVSDGLGARDNAEFVRLYRGAGRA